MSDTFQFATWPLMKPWSVAEHSYYVSISALFVLDLLQQNGYAKSVDRGELLSKALLHDIEEGISSDLPHPVKYALKKQGVNLDEVALDYAKEVLGELFNELLPYWVFSKAGDDGAIIKLADRIALAIYMIREINLGNRYLMVEADNIVNLVIREAPEEAEDLGLHNLYVSFTRWIQMHVGNVERNDKPIVTVNNSAARVL